MAVQMDLSNFSIINRAYGRQNAQQAYRAPGVPGASATDSTGGLHRMDRVTLSADSPQPLRADYVEDALEVGKTLAEGRDVTAKEAVRIREDRVFAAVAALALLGEDGSGQVAGWPGGFAPPTKAELETARRRLAQRLSNVEEAEDAEKVQDERLRLLDKIHHEKLSGLVDLRSVS